MNELLAQVAVHEDLLFAYGPMGIILAWFMFRAEKVAAKIGDLAHRIDGLTKALLIDMVERESSPKVREYARETIAKIDARNAAPKDGR